MIRTEQIMLFVLFFALSFCVSAQKNCGTVEIWQQKAALNPAYMERKLAFEKESKKWLSENQATLHQKKMGGASIITIPVVVHVLWHTAPENISNAQIQSQIDVLNEDFRLMNADSLPDTHPFWEFSVDAGIEFCLAQTDPNGQATNGITRTYTDTVMWTQDYRDDMKSTSTGGHDNWDATKYLNLWVFNPDPSWGILGFATFPSDLATEPYLDGVTVNVHAFGRGTGNLQAGNDYGRTATHEVGHWLSLHHIWGNDNCGTDSVADTKPAEDSNYGCPTFPHRPNNTCGGDADGEMYMNYMDYVDDQCMNMFTVGQSNRMDAALNVGRVGLLSSNGCNTVGIAPPSQAINLSIYPNPTKLQVHLYTEKPMKGGLIYVYDISGKQILSSTLTSDFENILDVSTLEKGIYFAKVISSKYQGTQKIIIY